MINGRQQVIYVTTGALRDNLQYVGVWVSSTRSALVGSPTNIALSALFWLFYKTEPTGSLIQNHQGTRVMSFTANAIS